MHAAQKIKNKVLELMHAEFGEINVRPYLIFDTDLETPLLVGVETPSEETTDIIEESGVPEVYQRDLSLNINAWTPVVDGTEANAIALRIERVFANDPYLDGMLKQAVMLRSRTIGYREGDYSITVLLVVYTIPYATTVTDPETIVF